MLGLYPSCQSGPCYHLSLSLSVPWFSPLFSAALGLIALSEDVSVQWAVFVVCPCSYRSPSAFMPLSVFTRDPTHSVVAHTTLVDVSPFAMAAACVLQPTT